MRDLSKAQFDAKCKRLGFVPQKVLGYYKLANSNTCVSVGNAGPRRRAQLAYLIEENAMRTIQEAADADS